LRLEYDKTISTFAFKFVLRRYTKGGKWMMGPRKTFFDGIEKALGGAPIVAEDLVERCSLTGSTPVLKAPLSSSAGTS
jgi:hypothetical protein